MSFIVRQKNVRGRIDIYYASSCRITGRKFPVQTRKYLGKLDKETNEMIKSRKLSNLTADELDALRKANITFKGRESPPPGPKPVKPKKVTRHMLSQWHSLELARFPQAKKKHVAFQ